MTRCCKYCRIPIPENGKKEYCTKYCKQMAEREPCPICSKRFLSFNIKQVYCSKKCRGKAKKIPTEWRECEWCGKEFEIDRIRRDRITAGIDSGRFCSRGCAFAWRKSDPKNQPYYVDGRSQQRSCKVYFEKCSVCDEFFATNNISIQTCSDVCKKEWRSIRAFENGKSKKKSIYKCKICEKYFEPEYGDKSKAYCSFNCKERARKEFNKIYKKKRERKIREVYVNDITIRKLHKRDKGICGICGEKIDLRLKCNDLRAATIDHILPLSKGGWHEWSNVQLAHRECNSKKGSCLPRQRQLSLAELSRKNI